MASAIPAFLSSGPLPRGVERRTLKSRYTAHLDEVVRSRASARQPTTRADWRLEAGPMQAIRHHCKYTMAAFNNTGERLRSQNVALQWQAGVTSTVVFVAATARTAPKWLIDNMAGPMGEVASNWVQTTPGTAMLLTGAAGAMYLVYCWWGTRKEIAEAREHGAWGKLYRGVFDAATEVRDEAALCAVRAPIAPYMQRSASVTAAKRAVDELAPLTASEDYEAARAQLNQSWEKPDTDSFEAMFSRS